MRRTLRWTLKGAAILLIIAALLALLGLIVMLLWNALIPQLFHGPVLQYWQAIGLLVLCRLLFGGLRGHRHRWHGRWQQLTPEERARLRERFAGRCGHGDSAAAGGGTAAP